MMPLVSTLSCVHRFRLAGVNCVFSHIGPPRLFGEAGRRVI